MPAPLHLVFDSWTQFGLVCGVLILAEAIYVLFGFGSGLIAVGTMALFLPEVQDIVVILLLVNLPPELFVVTRARRQISWRNIGLIVAGLVVGIPIGSLILKAGEPTAVLTSLGAVLVLVGAAFLFLPAGTSVRWPAWAAPNAGLLAGVLGGLFGTGGPPLIIYYQLAGIPKASFRGTLMAIFLLIGLVRIPVYLATGLLTLPRFLAALAVLPAVGIGALIGNRIHLQLEEPTFRRLVSGFLVVVGCILLAR